LGLSLTIHNTTLINAACRQQEIQAEWRGFISELAVSINVYIDFSRYEAVEEENVDGFEVRQLPTGRECLFHNHP
jgi:hypothetical protein